ncbi:metallophosphoesterase [Halobacterium sp. KA-4]|uniref:metallophosphoesterase family protein n=1 Tax=Halobacterium sp. KA-4 TaxID=2896367 RepID=UPI001E60CD71|nr:metallophosphoesterase [Halobacterium sp. KA-4]MCD2201390.1 metallophosphoesterase [Halobacterium sp. KA-4]
MPDISLPESAFRWAVEPGASPNDPLFVAHLSRPRTDDPTTLAVIADSHLTSSDDGTWKVYHRSKKHLKDAIVDINHRNVAGVLIAGDLTKDGTASEFRHARELLDTLRFPVVAIPGNHDVPASRGNAHATPPIARFDSGYDCELAPFVYDVDNIDLVGLDSVTATDKSSDRTHGGSIPANQISWIKNVLARVKCPIVASHHNLTDRLREISPDSPDIYQLGNAEAVANVLNEGGVKILLSGHAHYPTVAHTSGIYEIIVPATCSFPQGYALVHIGTDGTKIEFVPIADRAGLKEAWRFARADNREYLLRAATATYPIRTE